LQTKKSTESKVLGRSSVELVIEGRAGRISRKEAISLSAQEMGVEQERVGLVKMEGRSGSETIVAKFFIYASAEAKKKLHPRYLEERTLSKEERQKLRQERKKPAGPAQAPEAKK
jgi:ribosomal protein S24E